MRGPFWQPGVGVTGEKIERNVDPAPTETYTDENGKVRTRILPKEEA